MTTAIRTGQLSKRYLRLQALDQVSLEVPQGAAYALVGPNGAGKTTLIKILLNLIASSGGVRDAAYRAMGLRAIFLAMARKSGGAKEA